MSDYNGSSPIAGDVKTQLVQSTGADDYYVGMPVLISATTNKCAYSALGAAGSINAIAAEEKSVSADGYILLYITGTEFDGDYFVDDTNTADTATAQDIATLRTAGIIVR